MNRRHFLSVAGTAAGTAALPAGAARPASAQTSGKRARMVVGCQRGPTSDEMLQYFKRHGVDHICGNPLEKGRDGYTLEAMSRMRDRCEKHGVKLMLLEPGISSAYITRALRPSIMLGKSPERDREIDEVCQIIRDAAKVGIPALKYNMTILGVVRTESTPGRGGTQLSTWRLKEAKQDPPLTEAGPAPAEVMWERITYFLERVIPVAEEYKIRMACHPHDPGMPPEGFRGVDRVLGTVDGLKKFISIKESPYHGLNFCQGTVSEMLQDPGREIFDVIRYFGDRKKIFNVHFRNIRGKRDDFQEVFPDEGDVDMFQAMKVYKEVDYPYMMMPDHMPRHANDPGGHQAFAFAYGYIKALIQAVDQIA
jgi:mannonate dehydratase